jgi:hypothetical protein
MGSMRFSWVALLVTVGAIVSVAVLPAAALADSGGSAPSESQILPAEPTPNGFRLRATVNPGNLPTTYYFVYKESGAVECEDLEGCGSETPHEGPLTGDTAQEVTAEVTGLDPGTTYQFWLIARNTLGTIRSEELSFTAPATPPSIESESLSHVTSTDATLEATINPEDLPHGVFYQFQVVKNTGEYLPELACPEPSVQLGGADGCGTPGPGGGHPTPGALPIGFIEKGSQGQSVSQSLAAAGVTLQPGTTYHYRVLAVAKVQSEDTLNWKGPPVAGPDQTFTTPPGAVPVIDSVSLSHLTPTDATLQAKIDTEGLSTSYEFQLWSSPCSHKGAGCELIVDVPLPTGLLLGSFEPQSVSLDLNSAGVTLGGGEYGYSVVATNKEGSASAFGGVFEAPPGVIDPPSPGVLPPAPTGGGPSAPPTGGSQPDGSGTPSLPALQTSSPLGGSAKTGAPKGEAHKHKRHHKVPEHRAKAKKHKR